MSEAPISEDVRQLAATFNVFMPVATGEEHIEARGCVVCLGAGTHPAVNVVQPPRGA